MESYEEAYKKLNIGQRQAVETIEGPVMVVAGPGTGKTQVLALRIAYILEKTDIGADSILSLTFTRSGVRAMRERLERYIGSDARKVRIETFHSFAGALVEKHYQLLDFDMVPTLLDDTQAVLLVDELLVGYEWDYIRPRTNPAQYFGDLKQLISLLKREQVTPAQFLDEVEKEIVSFKEDPESISSRGATKGQLKKEIEKKIESLERTKEVVAFYRLYEEIKRERALMDYDDVLEYAVQLAEHFDDVRDDIRETYQYVLIDEHQDSSGIQNAFLKAVWQGVEQPNIFVVGDDRQLIYGFSGASLSYFEEFKHLFGHAELITLTDNYRSTQTILSLADELLKSSVSPLPLTSSREQGAPVGLYEYQYERDELLGATSFIKEKIAQGVAPESIALLVPKNRHVRSALSVLRSQGIPVASGGALSLFSQKETEALLSVLRVITDPYDTVSLSETLLDETSGISPLEAHRFLHTQKGKPYTLDTLLAWGTDEGMFAGTSAVALWGQTLKEWLEKSTTLRTGELVAFVGNELLVKKVNSHEALLRSVEVVRSFLHAVIVWEERHKGKTLSSFLEYLDRLGEYNHDIPLASFEHTKGVQVMTLHKSKGLEYDYVWIAHANEETLLSGKPSAFALPEVFVRHLEQKDRGAVTRELYVALTRAKKECVISYARHGYDDRLLTLSEILADLPKTYITLKTGEETEEELLARGPEHYIGEVHTPSPIVLSDITSFVTENYSDIKVSVTLLNNFFECPWKWYFRNFLKLPEVKSVSLALGSAVHSTIEYILKSSSLPKEKDIKEKIACELEKEGVSEGEERKRLSKDAWKAVERWGEHYYPHLAHDRMSERSLQGKDDAFPHLQMYGKIDLTERFPNGDIVVTDFKTGSVKTASSIEKETDDGRLSDYMRQLAMYSYLMRLAEKKDVARSRLLFVEAHKAEKNALYETHVNDEQVDLLIRDIREYDEALKSGEWASRKCHHKGYGTDKECEYCALAKVFKK